MKKNAPLPALFLMSAILLLARPASAQEVRVGLFYDSAAKAQVGQAVAELSGDSGVLVYLPAAGAELSVSYSQVLLGSGGQFVQIAAGQNFSGAYQQAREAKDKWAYNSYVAYRPDSTPYPWKVWVEGVEAAVRFHYPGAFAANGTGSLTVKDQRRSEAGLVVGDNLPLSFRSAGDSPLKITAAQNVRSYEGSLEVRTSGGKLFFVSILPLEKYVFGVVPYEMFESWPLEALKAQAVAARSYALTNINKHRPLGFNLCDAPNCCQKYGGFNPAHRNSARAVSETAGLAAFYAGKVAQLFYHSNSGGHTENAEDVWSLALPYAKAVGDPLSVSDSLLLHLVSRANNNTEFPARWLRSFTREQLESILREKELSVGTLLEIRPISKSAGGRHLEILVRGTAREVSVLRGATRTLFNLDSSLYEIIPVHQRVSVAGASGSREVDVNSGLFATGPGGAVAAAATKTEITVKGVTKARQITKIPLGFSFNGRGFGHGVGMSQWGAFEMARSGYTFEDILKYYFQGITIGPI